MNSLQSQVASPIIYTTHRATAVAMDSNTTHSTNSGGHYAQGDRQEFDQRQLYFPSHWQNSPWGLGLNNHYMNSPLIVSSSTTDLASEFASPLASSEASPCPSEAPSPQSRRNVPGWARHGQSLPMLVVDTRADGCQRQDRRRAQNRAAQQAYRERKEQLRQKLEVQVGK